MSEDAHPQTDDALWEEICEMFADLQGHMPNSADPMYLDEDTSNPYQQYTDGAILRDPNTGRHYYGIVRINKIKDLEDEEY
jgi:hypothetical protein